MWKLASRPYTRCAPAIAIHPRLLPPLFVVREIATTAMTTDNYEDALRELNNLQSNAQVIEALRASRGSMNSRSIPEMQEYVKRLGYQLSDLNTANIIHVTGTKGKGSTCAFTERILRDLGFRTGLFTSPHLVEVRERIRLNGAPISRELFAKYFFETRDRLLANKDMPSDIDMPVVLPTYFRFLTLMAFHTFISEKVDAFVMEVGIGGTYDATNVVQRPVVCGITSVGLDHQSLLGNTCTEIAHHKGGIIKPGVPVFSVQQQPDTAQALRERARELQAQSLEFVPSLTERPGFEEAHVLGLPGAHQYQNASLATALCSSFLASRGRSITTDVIQSISRSLGATTWPGRCQTVHLPGPSQPLYLLDGAHTAESMEACVQWYRRLVKGGSLDLSRPRVLVFNCTHDRNSATLLAPFADLHRHLAPFHHVCFCPNVVAAHDVATDLLDNMSRPNADLHVQHANAHVWAQLMDQHPVQPIVHVFADLQETTGWIDALAQQQAESPPVALVTGSLHLVGAAIAALQTRYHTTII